MPESDSTATSATLLDVDAVARRFGTSKRAIYFYCAVGLLPHVRLGRRVRFDRDQLDRFIASGGAAWRRPSTPTKETDPCV